MILKVYGFHWIYNFFAPLSIVVTKIAASCFWCTPQQMKKHGLKWIKIALNALSF